MKKFLNNYLKYIMLISIIPLSLYVKFFIIDYLVIWSYEIKAYLIFSVMIFISSILTILLNNKIIIIFFSQSSIVKKNNLYNLLSYTNKLFLFGNIILIASIFRNRIWIFLPCFQFFIILIFGLNYLTEKNKGLSKKEKFLSFKVIEDRNIIKKFKIMFLIALLYIFINALFLFIIQKNYSPEKKSLEYYMKDAGIKVYFK